MARKNQPEQTRPKRHIWAGLLKYAWRFHTGLHMDGKRRQTGRGMVLPPYSNYFWNRYSRSRRAAWRNCIFLVCVFLCFGFIKFRSEIIFLVLSFLPFLGFRVLGKLRKTFFQKVNYTDSDGYSEPYWVLRPRYLKLIRKLRPAKVRATLPDGGPVSPELSRAILADNAESNGLPVTTLRVMGEIQQESAPNGRERTMRRNAARRLPK